MTGRMGKARPLFLIGLATLAVVAGPTVLSGSAITDHSTAPGADAVQWHGCDDSTDDDRTYTPTGTTSSTTEPTRTDLPSDSPTGTTTRTATSTESGIDDGTPTDPPTSTATGTREDCTVTPTTTDSDETGRDTVVRTEVEGVTLVEAVQTQQRGDVVALTFRFSDGVTEANVTLGSSETVNFEVRFSIRDGDGDDEVVVLWNTARSDAVPDAGLSVENDHSGWERDSFSQDPRIVDGVSEPVEPAEYPVSVVRVDEGVPTDEGTIFLEEPTASDLTVHTAPASITSFVSPDDVESAASNAAVGDTVAVGDHTSDWLVLRLSASGLEGSTAAAADFDDDSDHVRLTITEAEENVGPNGDPLEMRLDGNATLIADGQKDTYYLAFRASTLLKVGAVVGDRFTATYTVDGASNVTESGATLSTSFTLVEGRASVDLQDGEFLTGATERSRVTGTTTWAPGTDLFVHLRTTGNTGNATPFSTSTGGVVAPDGTWDATFDLSEQSEGQPVRTMVIHENTSARLSSVPGTLGQLDASVAFRTQPAQDAGTLVVVDSVALERGGFVAIHQGDPTGPVVGTSSYLEAGSHSDVRIRMDAGSTISSKSTLVAVAHQDTDDDRVFGFVASDGAVDGPYTDDGEPVGSPAIITPADSSDADAGVE